MQNVVTLDGAVIYRASSGPLGRGETSQEVVLASFAAPDGLDHVLQLVVDAGDAVPEVTRAASDTLRTVAVSFCGWGSLITTGETVTFGDTAASWGNVVCLTDAVRPTPLSPWLLLYYIDLALARWNAQTRCLGRCHGFGE